MDPILENIIFLEWGYMINLTVSWWDKKVGPSFVSSLQNAKNINNRN